MRVFVTGAAGFVGGHLIPRLEEAGMTVTATDLEVDVTDPRSLGAATVIGNLHWPREVDRFTPDPDLGANTYHTLAEDNGNVKGSGHAPAPWGMTGGNGALMDGHVGWVPRELMNYRTGSDGWWRPHWEATVRY